MADRSSVHMLVELLARARRDGRRIPAAAVADLSIGDDEAYRVQKAIASLFGPVRAYKTGRKSPDAVPNAAPIFARDIRPSGAVFTDAELMACGVELEIAFRIDRRPPPPGPDFETELRACVSPLPAFELVDGRIDGFLDLPPGLKLSDNQLNGGFIFGSPIKVWDPKDLGMPTIALRIAGETVVEGPQPVPGGNAYDNLVAFFRAVDTHGCEPGIGDYVTTGSLNGMPFVDAPCLFEGRIEGLGEVTGEYRPASR